MKYKDQPLVGYFGFGSLVNRDTLKTSYVDILPATLMGWRRHWQARTDTLSKKVAMLSVHQDPSCHILGALVVDLAENLPEVDEREAGYTRHRLTPDDLVIRQEVSLPDDLYVYVANEAEGIPDNGALIQSYLDAVMQGFHRLHGVEGVSHFIETTASFERPVINDRHEPIYSRPVSLLEDERVVIDEEVSRSGAWMVHLQ